jgi:hypothetical protein
MPSIGNNDFALFVEKKVSPAGGLRVYNSGDPVPEITKLVGYIHAGVPILGQVKPECKDIFEAESINAIEPTYEIACAHTLFQVILLH